MSSSGRTAVLVDEHTTWLDTVESVLLDASTKVVGKATSFVEATALIEAVSPDLVVVETSDSKGAGLAWLAGASSSFLDVKFIALSTSDDTTNITTALASGAAAYVVKKANRDDLAIAVSQVYEHSIHLPRLLDGTVRPATSETVERNDLTRRELEILQLVAEGMSNTELAEMLWVAPQTVKFHLSNIYRKLGVANRTEASWWAQLHGLLPAELARSASAL